VCGNHLAVGDLEKFKVTMYLVGEEEEVVINVIKLVMDMKLALSDSFLDTLDMGAERTS
jgi:hypothetical protein